MAGPWLTTWNAPVGSWGYTSRYVFGSFATVVPGHHYEVRLVGWDNVGGQMGVIFRNGDSDYNNYTSVDEWHNAPSFTTVAVPAGMTQMTFECRKNAGLDLYASGGWEYRDLDYTLAIPLDVPPCAVRAVASDLLRVAVGATDFLPAAHRGYAPDVVAAVKVGDTGHGFVDSAGFMADDTDPSVYREAPLLSQAAWLAFEPEFDINASIYVLPDFAQSPLADLWVVADDGTMTLRLGSIYAVGAAAFALPVGKKYLLAIKHTNEVTAFSNSFLNRALELDPATVLKMNETGVLTTIADYSGLSYAYIRNPDTGFYSYGWVKAIDGDWHQQFTDHLRTATVGPVKPIGGQPAVGPFSTDLSMLFGPGAYISTHPSLAGQFTTAMTASLWVGVPSIPPLPGEEQMLISNWTRGGGWRLRLSDTNSPGHWGIELTFTDTPGNESGVSAPISVGPHHVGFTFDNGDAVLYIDGAAVATVAAPLTELNSNKAPTIGGSSSPVHVAMQWAVLAARKAEPWQMRRLATGDHSGNTLIDVTLAQGHPLSGPLLRMGAARSRWRLVIPYNVGGIATSTLRCPFYIGDPIRWDLISTYNLWGPVWKHLEAVWTVEGVTRVDLACPYVIVEEDASDAGLARGLYLPAG